MVLIAELQAVTGWAVQRAEESPAVTAGYKRLAGAVVLSACHDVARGKEPEAYHARRWLLSNDAALYLEVIGISRREVERWLNNGAPMPMKRVGKRQRES